MIFSKEARDYMKDNRGSKYSNLNDALLLGLFLGENQVLNFLQVFPLYKNFKVIIALTFGLFGNNTGV